MTNHSSNPLLRTSKPTISKDNPFLQFSLRDNPFPDAPTISPFSSDPKQNGKIYVKELRDHEQQRFDQVLIPHSGQPEPRSIAFLMDFATKRGRGIGKTAFLQYQRRQIMEDLGGRLTGDAYVLLAAYVDPEGNGKTRRFWQFIRSIAQALNQCDCIAWAMWRLRALSGIIPAEMIEQVINDDPSQTLGNNAWLDKQGVDVTFALNHHVKQTLLQSGVEASTAEDLAYFGHDHNEFERQLNKKGDYWWRQEGKRLVFDDLVRTFRAAGIDRTLLLVDEVEKIVLFQNRDERRGFVDDIRHFFVDGPYQSVYNHFYGLLLTIHPSIQEIWTPHWNAAGLDRVCPISGPTAEQHTLYFYPIEAEEHAEKLVLAYMDFFRESDDLKGDLQPFDKDAIATALKISRGVPGHMLKLLNLVMEQAVREKWETIGAAQVNTIQDASRTPSEPENEDENGILPSARTNLLD